MLNRLHDRYNQAFLIWIIVMNYIIIYYLVEKKNLKKIFYA